MAFLHYIGMFFALAATALLIIVSVGVPIWNQIDMLHAVDRTFLMGIWGISVNGQDSASRLGFEATTAVNGGQTIVLLHKSLSYALVVNPIAAGFAFVAFAAALFTNTACGIFASLLAFWAFVVTLVALGLDLGAFILARNRLNNNLKGANAELGKAIWMVVAAAGCLLIASLTVCFTHSSHKRRKDRDIETRPLTNESVTAPRGWFGRRNNHAVAADGTTSPVMNEKKRHFWQRKNEPVVY